MKQPDEIIWHLKNFNIFEAISEVEMDRLQQMISTDWIKHRDPVFLSGEPNRWVYFLKQGLIKLSMTSEEEDNHCRAAEAWRDIRRVGQPG